MPKSTMSRFAIIALVAAGAGLSAVDAADARGGRHFGHGGHFHGHTLPFGNAAIRPSGFVPSSRICSWELRIVHGEPRPVRICDALAY
jgi:hypothetical protein